MRAIPNTPGDLRSADGSYSGFHRGIFIHIVPTGRHELSSFDILALTPSSDLGWNELPGRSLPAAPLPGTARGALGVTPCLLLSFCQS